VTEPSTTPAAPFNPQAVQQVPRGGPGCSKPLITGCAIVLLLFAAGAVVFVVELPRIVHWWFETFEATIAPRLPADLSHAERDRLHRAFVAAHEAVSTGQADIANLQSFQRKLLALADPKVKLTHQDVLELTEALEKLAQKPGAAPQAPSPPASPSPPSPASPAAPPAAPAPPATPPPPQTPPGGAPPTAAAVQTPRA
jgi:hypothetical protein